MKCDFCGHEVDKGTVECPYCHYRFKIDAQVLSPEERDTFEGVTIDEGAGTAEDSREPRGEVYEERASYEQRQQQEQRGENIGEFAQAHGVMASSKQKSFLWLRQWPADDFFDSLRYPGGVFLLAAHLFGVRRYWCRCSFCDEVIHVVFYERGSNDDKAFV